jgi:hypothetical protein
LIDHTKGEGESGSRAGGGVSHRHATPSFLHGIGAGNKEAV